MELVLECLNSDQKRLFASWESDESVGLITSSTYSSTPLLVSFELGA